MTGAFINKNTLYGFFHMYGCGCTRAQALPFNVQKMQDWEHNVGCRDNKNPTPRTEVRLNLESCCYYITVYAMKTTGQQSFRMLNIEATGRKILI